MKKKWRRRSLRINDDVIHNGKDEREEDEEEAMGKKRKGGRGRGVRG